MKIKALLVFLTVLSINIFAQKVYVVDINTTIDGGLAPYIKRVINEAENSNAKAIIFKINTFGGRVDAATQIKDAILNSKVQTVAFIDKRAISAGALISLSCKKIVMVEGASIGASTVVDEQGHKQSEKYQAYMRGEMRSTAERTGRRTDIAEAMVDERVAVKDIQDDSTKLVSLTSKEALRTKICDTILTNIDETLKFIGIPSAQIIDKSPNFAEQLVSFVSLPLVTSILILIGLVGLYTEIKAPGLSFPGIAAVISFGLLFGSNYILQLASSLEIIIFIIGVLLLIAEIFFIPGFGIAGVAGIILTFGSLFFILLPDFPIVDNNFIYSATIQLATTFVLALVIAIILAKFLPKSKHWNKLILNDTTSAKEGYIANNDLSFLIGIKGKTLTVMRPSGTVILNSKKYDALSVSEYIEANTQVKVISVEGSKIFVEKY